MRLGSKLVQVAALVAAAGCGGTTSTGGNGPGLGDAGTDGMGPGGGDSGPVVGMDSGPDAPVGCGGCGCGTGNSPTHDVSTAQACQVIAQSYMLSNPGDGPACTQVCGPGTICDLPASFVMQVQALNPDAGPPPQDGGMRVIQCPSGPATVTVTCSQLCVGRLTEGYSVPAESEGRCDGDRLAAMAYLEAVSVHAFDRLERELEAHGAPPVLLRDARRARRDEVRHTAMMARLARSRGRAARMPAAPAAAPARSLFAIALENAVEGCVRETYGAVAGLVEAQTSADAPLRRAMASVAADECRHAELAWAVHAWALPRLTGDERRRVESAMRAAVGEIARTDPRTTGLLFTAGRTAIA